MSDGEARSGRGAVYAFAPDREQWKRRGRLDASAGGRNDRFGASLALAPDEAFVGAPDAETEGELEAGRIDHFVRADEGWERRTPRVGSKLRSERNLGTKIVLEGDTAVFGGSGHYFAGQNGTAHVFGHDADGGWTERQVLTAPNPDDNGRFGTALAIDGDTILVGDNYARPDAEHQGAAYVYTREEGRWERQEQLTPPDDIEGRRPGFGAAVALAGDSAFVGASSATPSGNEPEGAVYVYERSADGWDRSQTLTLEGDRTAFGRSITADAGVVVVGASGHTGRSPPAVGAVALFVRGEEAWTERRVITDPSEKTRGRFGADVAISPRALVVGAPSPVMDRSKTSGDAYLFEFR